MKTKKSILFLICMLLSCLTQITFAKQFQIASDSDVIGEVLYKTNGAKENLLTIGQENNIGVNGMLSANPGFKEHDSLPENFSVVIPTQFILPEIRRGIVVNLPEMRMYYFPDASDKVITFPIGIGKVGKTIPTTYTSVLRKTVNPTWIPTKDIHQFNKEQGINLPSKIGPGPDNPLGPYAIYLRLPTFLIHSTIFPESIGRRASFGCIRMNESDIKLFFPMVKPGTPVSIIDLPTKVGWNDNTLFLESHPPLIEKVSQDDGIKGIMSSIEESLPADGVTLVNWQTVAYVAEQRDGMPHEIGIRVR